MSNYLRNTWFREPGAYVLVDGQFGSTGKGLMAAYIAQHTNYPNKITTNAGPNSGHTAYWPASASTHRGHDGYEKIVTRQLPVASVFYDKMGLGPFDTIINAGAIIDHGVMLDEFGQWINQSGNRVLIHPNAALIHGADKAMDKATLDAIASTGKGIGPAMANKLLRQRGKRPLASEVFLPFLPEGYNSWDDLWDWGKDRVFVETAQGYSLGLNSARFYPHVTSRECTVQQALADARIPARRVQKVCATYRTYPIRVGNTTGSSGDCYPDQKELTWEEIGVKPETTTVTGRVRRVFTWSWIQFRESLKSNEPDCLLINFLNYIDNTHAQRVFMAMVEKEYRAVMGRHPDEIFIGEGPYNSDVKPLYHG